jgi:hypothetical protein
VRIVRLSIFNKLLIGWDLRMGFEVRVLLEEPIFGPLFRAAWVKPKGFCTCVRRTSCASFGGSLPNADSRWLARRSNPVSVNQSNDWKDARRVPRFPKKGVA